MSNTWHSPLRTPLAITKTMFEVVRAAPDAPAQPSLLIRLDELVEAVVAREAACGQVWVRTFVDP